MILALLVIDLWLESTFQLFSYYLEYVLGQYSQISLYLTHVGVKNGGFESVVSTVSRFFARNCHDMVPVNCKS